MTGYIQDNDNDLMLANGDFVRGDIRQDIVIDTLNFMPGDNKEFPQYGCGLRTALGGKPDAFFSARAKKQCEQQTIILSKIKLTNEGIEIEISDK